MKKTNRFFTVASFIFGCGISMFANVLNINGVDQVVDTIIPKHQVGPGTTYAFYHCPNRPLTIHVLEADLTNPYLQLEACNGGQKAVGVETTTSMFSRNDAPGHDMIAAHNGSFYHTSETDATASGMSRMGLISKGECLLNPVSLPIFVLTDDKVPYLEQLDFNATVSNGTTSTRLHTLNTHFLEFDTSDDSGERMMLFTNAYGSATNNLAAGTKVVIVPSEGSFFFSANTTVKAVVESITEHSGSAAIPAGKALLFGTGANATFLNNLTVGQECTITLSSTMPGYPSVKNIKEGLGGSGHSIIRDGEVVISGNPDIHPRTFMGISRDGKTLYSVAVDGRWTGSAGVTLDDEGRILKWLGAWHGLNLDGGGSTTMVVNSEIKNHTSEAERAVGDALLFYSNAPSDDNIGQIAFGPRSFNVPVTARFRPDVYGYNQYGVLKSKDLQGVKITCDPQIGQINDNNEFIATSEIASGYIYAEYNGCTTKQFISTINSPVSLAAENYIVDNRKGYPIQLTSQIGNFNYDVDAASVEWTVADESVCSISDGKVTGLKNGTTRISGTSDKFSGAVNITVEIPESDTRTLLPEYTDTTWTLKQTGGTGITYIPDGEGFKLSYTGNGTARGANINMASGFMKTYSLPYALKFDINPGDAIIKIILLKVEDNYGKQYDVYVTNEQLPTNTVTSFTLQLSDIIDIDDNAQYPISITNINFTMGVSKAKTAYEIAMSKFEQIYGDPSGIENITSNNCDVDIFPNPVNQGEAVNINVNGDATIDIYSLGGKLVRQVTTQGDCSFSTAGIPAGLYIVKVSTDDDSTAAKLIIR